jgi:autotransporter-associated beta strand protein
MRFQISLSLKSLLSLFVALPLVAASQTLTITSGVQTYIALTNTTVTMTGHCELHLTATNNPMPGCTLNLNSPDSWIFFSNIPPSVVSASYLGQLLVNSASAVAGSNCQLTECGMGSVIIPQPSSFTPLQVFSGPNLVGPSAQFGVYTYYNTPSALGAMYQNISSFTLKRGYMATFAQNANGTGASQVYIAQDSDLSVGLMASNLIDQCSFVRVFPWRYTVKKGWGGGTLITNTSPLWSYDWGNSASSTPNVEYVPIKWSSSSGTSSINNMQNVTEVLGYNEPDNPSQADMTVAQAITDWPNMMQWGLRVGAPAVSSSGVTGQGVQWLYAFMDQANSLGYRVDYIPIHYYQCDWTTAQFSNYLAQVYETTGKPIWVTEWNNGANWCTSGQPTSQAAQATAISSDIAMLESAPFVERYAIYQWFDPSTYLNLVSTNTVPTLTPAGVVYLNQQSKVAYTQTLPPGGSRSIAQFLFATNCLDTSGYANNGFAVGDPNYVAGETGQAVALDGTNSYIRLPPTFANSTDLSFAAWIYWNGGGSGQHIFDFGNDPTHYLYLSPSSSSGTLRFGIRNGGTEQDVDAMALPSGQWVHVAVTLNGNTVILYTNGVQAAVSTSISIAPSSIAPILNYLGKSQASGNPLFNGELDNVEMADSAFTAGQIAALLTNVPPQFTTNLIYGGSVTQAMAYAGSLAGLVTDANPGDTLTYSKIGGPAWLNVAANGTLSGTPTLSNTGTNYFTVGVQDAAGPRAFAEVVINTVISTANGVWDVDASGNWSNTNNWSGGEVANGSGFTADFSTVSITANRTVTLDASPSIGTVKFGSPSGSQSWTLAASGGNVLTLNTGTGGSPSVAVNQNTATISAPLAGTAGFTKSGAGILTLAGTNTYSGTTVISAGTLNFSSATQTMAGIISGGGALAQSSGALTLSAYSTYTGGTTVNGGTMNLAVGSSTGTIRSNLTINAGATVNLTAADALGYPPGAIVTGINIVGGTLTNGSGGNEAFTTTFNLTGGTISSGGGYYNLDGANAAINSLATNVVSTINAPLGLRASGLVISTAAGTVPGGVDLNLSGAMADLQGSGYGWIKSGAGTLLLSGVNTNTGPVTISAGTLLIGGAGELDNGSYAANIINNGLFNYNSSAAQALSGVISGTGALTQSGSGTLTLSGANTYSGNTIIAGGTLALATAGSIASTRSISISNSATLNVSASGFTLGPAQTLTGNGTVMGNLKVNGTLAPGGNLGTLTCKNNVTLQAVSTNVLELNPALGTNDQLLISGTLACAGTLVVTNLFGTLGAGESFKLFSAASYSGGFSAFNLPQLGTGLGWITTNLILNGTLSVIATAPPGFSSIAQRSDGNFQFSGTGAAGVTYDLEASTNLVPPIAWQLVANTVANQSGMFQFVDLQATNFSQRFYCIFSVQ